MVSLGAIEWCVREVGVARGVVTGVEVGVARGVEV